MKRGFHIALVALAVCAVAFGLTRWTGCSPSVPADGDVMAWMQKEFLLTPAQTAAIRKLHEAYEPVCAEHCLRIQKSRTELAAATDANTRAAIQADLDRFSRICHDSTLAHLRQVAALMPPGQGRRFLALTEPKLETTEHVQPLGLK